MFAFLVYTLLVWNLPSSEIRSELRPGLRPVVNAMAIDQSWSVFAPNPTTVSIAVEADAHEIGAGSWLRMDADVPHSVTALEPSVMLLSLLR